jgi:hypothetical protein
MFSAAFDASGTEHDQEALVVAGFIAPAAVWIDFGKAWRARLAEEGLSDFHMADFMKGYGVYSEWKNDKARRAALLSDLIGIVQSHASRQFGCAVVIGELHSLTTKSNRDRFLMHAYCLAAIMSITQVQRWCHRERIVSPPEFIFEKGDDKQHEFRLRMQADSEVGPVFRWKKDTMDKRGQLVLGYTPLQAADMLAYECFQATTRYASRRPPQPTWMSKQFDRMAGDVSIWECENLQKLEDYMNQERSRGGI